MCAAAVRTRQFTGGEPVLERAADRLVESDPRTGRADDDLARPAPAFRSDIERAAANQRVETDLREIEQHLDRALGQAIGGEAPVELHPARIADQSFGHFPRLVDRYGLTEPARSAEREAEELELVGTSLSTLLEQFEALLPHLRIALVCEQFETIRQCAYRRQQVVAQARTEHRGKVEFGSFVHLAEAVPESCHTVTVFRRRNPTRLCPLER